MKKFCLPKITWMVLLLSVAVFGQDQFPNETKGTTQPIVDQDNSSRVVLSTSNSEIQGSLGIGSDIPANYIYGFDTFVLAENNLRIYFNDTSNSGSFPNNDWRLTANDSDNGGGNYFSIDDATANRQIFRLDAAAPANSLRINSSGNIGMGVDNAAVELHIRDGNTSTLRLDQDGSGGFGAQIWDVSANETNFFIRDGSSNTIPFRIQPSASTGALAIGSSGNVGVGMNGLSFPNNNVSLDLNATDKGLQLNRLTTNQRNTLGAALGNLEVGVLVFDTEDGQLYTWDGQSWIGGLVDTDNQTVDIFQINGNNLELSLEDDGVATQQVDLSGYLDNTDNQDISGSALANNILTIGISGGNPEMVDLSVFDDSGTDDQQLSLTDSTLILEDGGTVDLAGFLDNTDNQNIEGSSLVGTNLTVGISGGASQTIDLSSLSNMGTDDQTLGNFLLTNQILGITIEDGNAVQVNLAPLLQPLEDENAAQQAQIDALLANSLAQQALIDDLIARVAALEDCACGTLIVPENNPNSSGGAYLFQNVPNPFGDTTSIGYFIPEEHSRANLIISATTGQIISNIAIRKFGEGTIEFNKANLQSAMYHYTLYVDGKKVDTKRMLVK